MIQGIVVVYFFLQRQTGSLTQQIRTLDKKEALVQALSLTSYLTSQAVFSAL